MTTPQSEDAFDGQRPAHKQRKANETSLPDTRHNVAESSQLSSLGDHQLASPWDTIIPASSSKPWDPDNPTASCTHFGCPWDVCNQASVKKPTSTEVDLSAPTATADKCNDKRDSRAKDSLPETQCDISVSGHPRRDSFDHKPLHKVTRSASLPSPQHIYQTPQETPPGPVRSWMVGRYHPLNYLINSRHLQRNPYPTPTGKEPQSLGSKNPAEEWHRPY